jgi:hypothetical protein
VSSADARNSRAFTPDPAILRPAAQAVQAEKHTAATVLLNELHFKFDEHGKMMETRHLIYRIENQDGVADRRIHARDRDFADPVCLALYDR